MKRFIWVVVIAVFLIFLLAVVVLPSISATLQKISFFRSQTQVQILAQGLVVFADGHDDQMPTTEQWPGALIELGVIETEMLVSFADDGDGVSYIYMPGPNSFDETQILIYEDPKHWEEGVIVGFADGHVEVVPHEEFEIMLAEQLAEQPAEP